MCGARDVAVEEQVDSWIDASIRDACSRRSPDRRRSVVIGRDAGMKRAELAGQDALAESPVAGSQHRSAIGGQFRRDTEARRQRRSRCTAFPGPG